MVFEIFKYMTIELNNEQPLAMTTCGSYAFNKVRILLHSQQLNTIMIINEILMIFSCIFEEIRSFSINYAYIHRKMVFN